MKEQARFWFVHARNSRETVNLAVAAFTERSARVQARKRLGPRFTITEVGSVDYAHAWVMHHGWKPIAEPLHDPEGTAITEQEPERE